MMTVEPTCRFCHHKLAQLTPFQSRGRAVYSCYCIRCKSEQLFEKEGKALEYSFTVGDYLCLFPLTGPKFEIHHINGESGTPDPKVIFKLDFVPHHITPQTMTVERIKTLILFS